MNVKTFLKKSKATITAPWKAFQLTKYLNVNKIKQSPYLQTLINSQDRRDEF